MSVFKGSRHSSVRYSPAEQLPLYRYSKDKTDLQASIYQ